MLKRAADWFEKMSVVAMGVGLFEEKSAGIAFGLACICACLYLTSKLEGREVIAWLFAAIACMGVFVGALYFNHVQAKEEEKRKAAQPKPAAEEVIPRRPDANGVGKAVPLSAEMMQRSEAVQWPLKKGPKAPAEEVGFGPIRDLYGVEDVKIFQDASFMVPRIKMQDIYASMARQSLEHKIRSCGALSPWTVDVFSSKDYGGLCWAVINKKGGSNHVAPRTGHAGEKGVADDDVFAKARA